MTEPRFRVVDRTPTEFPNLKAYFLEERSDRGWHLAIHDGGWICFNDRAKADTVAGKLERGESIADDMKRTPARVWDAPGWSASKQFVQKP